MPKSPNFQLGFAVAVAVGLTPEMLPMIVTVNLSKGALAMAREKVIVKRLHSIQNLGAMDVLCTDKTGTLTEGKIVLEQHVDVRGNPSDRVLHYGYLNSYHHTGLKNLMDEAILDHEELEDRLKAKEKYRKIDEIPFDFVRRRMSVIVEEASGTNTLICKGAVEEVLKLCLRADVEGAITPLTPEDVAAGQDMLGEPLRPGNVSLAAVEDCFHQRVAAGDGVSDDPDIRAQRELIVRIAFDQLYAQCQELLAHRRVDVGVAARHPVAGFAGKGRDPAHERAANTEDMQVQRRVCSARKAADCTRRPARLCCSATAESSTMTRKSSRQGSTRERIAAAAAGTMRCNGFDG